ncbi:hypothetical protein PTSG_12982 [Salpingoeca rosetta]|uniref:Uncharacterized protein n=1 Tax=Salpingoeca rosetta (strain ATCC 50818 / BSB-021) TaxID=946362 RepID=F2UPC8_SALR5|nr:uncharacterized protein PTSG_12982 [Salpingoeca rosetta]EGD79483.1 hypothetical protein PTSG_12982 [Salpingoeca rosetta]|eukprot:XP_004988964.1 hypothetical protein PTSG_12982 [Salpingoeca rosetta]
MTHQTDPRTVPSLSPPPLSLSCRLSVSHLCFAGLASPSLPCCSSPSPSAVCFCLCTRLFAANPPPPPLSHLTSSLYLPCHLSFLPSLAFLPPFFHCSCHPSFLPRSSTPSSPLIPLRLSPCPCFLFLACLHVACLPSSSSSSSLCVRCVCLLPSRHTSV